MKTSVSAPLVKAIENVWTEIQAQNPDVPDVVVTLGSGAVSYGMKLGHFAANVWTHEDTDIHELFVGGEGLQRGAKGVLGTLLHEAAHAVAEQRQVKDTSRQGRYHNKNFKAIAEEMGISVIHSESLGWSTTEVPEETVNLYSIQLLELDACITAYRHGFERYMGGSSATSGGTLKKDPEGDEPKASKPKNGLVLECQCETPRKIRVAATVAELGDISCSVCGEVFTEGGYIKLG